MRIKNNRLLLILLFLSLTLLADTETLRPNGVGSTTNMSQEPVTGNNWDKVDEETEDSDVTYVYTSSSVYDLYEVADHSTGSGTINSVTIHAYISRASGSMTVGYTTLRTEGTTHSGTGRFINVIAPTYWEITEVYTTNPTTDNAWTWGQVDAMEMGSGRSTGPFRCTQVYAVIDYTPSPEPPNIPTLLRIFDNAIYNAWYEGVSTYECTLSVKSTAPEEDSIQYEIQWDTDPLLGSPYSKTTSYYGSGVEATTTIDLEPSDPEQVYYWNARALIKTADWQYRKKITIDHTKVSVTPAPWYNTDWLYRKKITIDNTKVPNTDQINFPVLINRTDTDWKYTGNGGYVGQSDGGDILFTLSDGTTKLDHEIEEYTPSTGELIAWVEVTTVSASTNTDIYIYYGNANDGNQWNPTGIWDSYYEMVQHMADATSSTIEGSTSNGITGTKGSSNNPNQASGKIGYAQYFNSGTDVITYDDNSFWNWRPVTQDRTLSLWWKSSSLPNSQDEYQMFLWGDQSGARKYIFMFVYNVDRTTLLVAIVDSDYVTVLGDFWTSFSPSTNRWYHIALVASSYGDCRIYVDGVSQSLTYDDWDDDDATIYPATNYSGAALGFLNDNETIDELRWSHTNRSADWIATCYNNQDSPSTFYSVGSVEEQFLTNFPVLINRTDTDWKYTGNGGHVGQSDGGDIFFTSSNGITQLDHEIEEYDETTGELVAWVEVPTVSNSTDTDIYIYYGNTGCADQWDVSGTWDEGGDNNYVAVWHLEENPAGTPPQMKNSTGDYNHGTSQNMTAGDQVDGQINGSLDFDGSDDRIDIPHHSSLDITGDKITLEVWMRAASDETWFWNKLIHKPWSNASWNYPYSLYELSAAIDPDPTPIFAITIGGTHYQLTSSQSIAVANWYHIVGVYDGSQMEIFINGVSRGTTPRSGNISSQTTVSKIAFRGDDSSNESFRGIIDEVRISNMARSANWIATCYNNQDSPSTFYSVDAEEECDNSLWSGIRSFTMDIELGDDFPYWYQVAGPQFEQGTKNGVTVQGDLVVLSGTAAEVVFQGASGSTGLSHSIDIGSAGNDRLVVVIAGDESSGTSLTNVTVDGKNCTKAGEADNPEGSGNHQELWYILEETLGSSNGTVTVTCTGGDAGWATHVHVYYGVKQSTPYDFEVEEAIVGGTTISVENVSSLNGSVVIFGAGQGGGGLTPSWISPLTGRTDVGPDPSSADLATASDLESTGQTDKTYVCTWSGSFNRGTGIVAVWEPSESNEGTLISPPIVFADLFTESSNNRSHWDGVKWTKSSAADSIGIQIEYKDGGTWSLVLDDDIPGNSNGFFFPTAYCYIDLSSISTSIYDTLRMKATFKSYTAKSASDPALLMWALGSKSGITGVSSTNKPLIFALSRNKPNPFTNRTEIRYQIPKRVKVELQVFDVIGRSVVTLVNKEQKPGYYSIQWRGTDKNKKLLPSGVYFLRMEAGDFKATQKMVRLR